jgi:hypothetical protein
VAEGVNAGVVVGVDVGCDVDVSLGVDVGLGVEVGCGVDVGSGVNVVVGVGVPQTIVNSWPTWISSGSVIPLAIMRASTVVPYRMAMEYKLSPAWTT